MDVGLWTRVVGGLIGAGLAVFGVRMLLTGRMPPSTERAFRSARDAGWYHLLFGAGLLLVVFGQELPGGVLVTYATAVLAVLLVGWALVKFRPRGRRAVEK